MAKTPAGKGKGGAAANGRAGKALRAAPQREASNLKVNGPRLWESLMEMAKIGGTPKGGVCRLTLTDVDRRGRELFADWCRKAGCTVSVDRIGNMFARRPGTDPKAAPVLVGSHLDSQPTGGKFDGALGVLAALELVRTLNDLDLKTRHPIEVVNWTNEEGSRYAPSLIASGVFAGVFPLDYALGLKDAAGARLGDELERIGFAGPAPVGGRPVHAYFELHIEQGPILEEEGIDIGVVTGAQGQIWYELTLTGQEAHAGTTPMEGRKDALLGAAKVIELVNRIGVERMPDGRSTVGVLDIHNASRNVVPGSVFLTAEFRHPEQRTLDAMDAALRKGIAAIAREAKLSARLEENFRFPPQPFDAACVAAVRRAAEKLGLSHRNIISGAGHDAVYVARMTPTAMIFTPCVDGLSHNEAEDIRPAWATAGCDVLLHAVLDKAEVVGR